ncbi:cytochrome c [Gluconobacter japonicus]|uniref:c-type cytochrome n=1 Tax=Gluconobacter japonicus TaxID=376620 RepID=UPI001B8D50C7|nr:cytochrome c [Gluconobacter japonicus]MBS1050345.1 cytochrome c [Gluconobacter japonicus]
MKFRTFLSLGLVSAGLTYAQAAFSDDSASIERGRYVAIAADCVACHTNPADGRVFGGGYALKTPFGTLLASNITMDKETGIGSWTEEQFTRAVRDGIGKDGEHLYAAMPYPSYTKMTDQDMHDLWSFMKTVQPVSNKVISNQLPFPFNIRASLIFWNLWNFRGGRFTPDTNKSAEWNRGAYLVEALEHCNACHTPKNFLGGDLKSKAYYGTSLQGWYAPNITNSKSLGIGTWSKDDLVTYLKTGSVHYYVASGPMGEAIEHSTQHLTDSDLSAVAEYFATVNGPEIQNGRLALSETDPQMRRGKAVYEYACEACHKHDGTGVTTMIAGFPGNQVIRADVTDTLIHTVLVGGRGAITHSNPTGAAMPTFAWTLNDEQIAAALTYIRNNWGNSASAVTASDVAKIRSSVEIKQVGPVPDDWSLPGFRAGLKNDSLQK